MNSQPRSHRVIRSPLKWTCRVALLLGLMPGLVLSADKEAQMYLGQKPPGIIPELFAPGIVCTGFYERDIAISPDGSEIFYGLLTNRFITIMHTRLDNGKWSEPEAASFAQDDRFFFLEPCFSSDGKTLYFLSTHPPQGQEPKPRWFYQNIWASNKKSDGTWGDLYNPDTLLNQQNNQFYPSLTKAGTLYFTRSDAKTDQSTIWRARGQNGRFETPQMLPAPVNQEGMTHFNACIAPDESFLIGCVGGRETDINPGCVNYYIFYRNTDDTWCDGIPLGAEINIKGSNAISASLSPDGKYLFFAAQKLSKEMAEKSQRKTLKNIIEMSNNPQNGSYDIYWVDVKILPARP